MQQESTENRRLMQSRAIISNSTTAITYAIIIMSIVILIVISQLAIAVRGVYVSLVYFIFK